MTRIAATVPSPHPRSTRTPGDAGTSITLGEALVGGVIVGATVVGASSLALAHARVWSLPAVVAASTVVLGLVVAVLVRGPDRPRVRVAPGQLAVLAVLAVLGIVLFVPGFPVGMAGWDPGVYVEHALAIPRTGAYDLPDPALAVVPDLPGVVDDADVRLPGLDATTTGDGRSTPAFYHLYPALLAPAADLAGERGVVSVNPLLGIVGVWAAALVGWRAFSPLAGALAGLLLATNMIWVWHARLPTSEVLTAVLLLAATLGVSVAVRERWGPAAGLAGVATGCVFLARADGMIVLVLAVATLGALGVAGRFGRRAAWFAGGLALVTPHALLQAYHFSSHYTRGQGLPGPALLLGVLALPVAAAVVSALARRQRGGPVASALRPVLARVDRVLTAASETFVRRRIGVAVAALFAAILLYNVARPALSDAVLEAGANLDAAGDYYDPRSLLRLSWFLTPAGVVAAWAGLTLLAVRRWRFDRWVVAAPTLLLLPVYLQEPRIALRLMWWTRRFVPYNLAGLLLLTATALAAGLLWRGKLRLPVRAVTAVVAVVIVGSQMAMSFPLRSHHELDGSLEVHQALARLAPDGDGLYLWVERGESASAFASTLVYRTGAVVAALPPAAGPDEVDAWLDAFPDRPAHLVTDADALPPQLAGLDAEPVHRVQVALPMWQLTFDERPTAAAVLPFDFTVWSLPGR